VYRHFIPSRLQFLAMPPTHDSNTRLTKWLPTMRSPPYFIGMGSTLTNTDLHRISIDMAEGKTPDATLEITPESDPVESGTSIVPSPSGVIAELQAKRARGEPLTKREISTLNLGMRKHPLWQQGQSGNPSGRPKKITSALEKKLTRKRALKVADAIIEQAEKGSVAAFESLANRIEGKVPQGVTGSDDGAVQIEIITHLIGASK
jgi:uncharacterized protein DUF5681